MHLLRRTSQHSRRVRAVSAATALLVLGLVASAPGFSTPAAADSTPSCADSVTSGPTGPRRSRWQHRLGRVLVVGSGDQPGVRCTCSPPTRSMR